MSGVILVVDDDPVQRRLLDAMVRRLGFEAVAVDSGEAALAALAGSAFDAVLLDLVMPDLDGMAVLTRLRDQACEVPAIVQTANGSIDAVVSAMRAGAVDFVVKPVGIERLSVSLKNALATRALENEIRRFKRAREGTLTFSDVLSRSARMAAVLKLANKAAASAIPVLIEGESGTGKELVARAIHGSGARCAKPFVAVNCGAIPESLVESILFGHEKGAFTGAFDRHTGKFVDATGGTLFLDEIGELSPDAQVKLLRVLQTGEVDPVGSRRTVKVDVRVMSATNRDLLTEVKAGRFREDLYYRLAVFPLALPPLRARREDIADLVRHFAVRFAAEEGKRIRTVSSDALRLLAEHPWPGNVRQLENAVFRAVVLAETDELTPAEFPQIAARIQAAPALAPTDLAFGGLEPLLGEPADAPLSIGRPGSAAGGCALPLRGPDGHVVALAEVEGAAIRHAIRHYRGQMTEVARRLKIGRSTLYRRLKELGLDADSLAAETGTAEAEAADAPGVVPA
ncbi:sigma-54-dependent transcriptional regulator [Blastochloris sulfoviridis]|uniref:DNA-binding transcriptional regulator NtrC n=1 Tax=Blastochloris sulfoviridis TaxID=50712 RepID=A0A5M6I042_9HYPH|nr:sigma-54 dependent transcriptional regulator [Blastochloris sulfoviridis]KAA5601197.1 sigma-54-dependent Fis family transcriptional regulator [Blastochloris sulfoviridis]